MVDEKYRSGTQPYTCPNCSQKLQTNCRNNGETEQAFCTTCKIEYIRQRSPVLTKTTTKSVESHSKPSVTTYYCTDCQEPHQKTRPVNGFQPPEAGFKGYEDPYFVCLCGRKHQTAYMQLENPLHCDCGRTYKFQQENKHEFPSPNL